VAAAGVRFAQEHFVFAQVIYPERPDDPGLLVYLRPTLTGDEGDSLLHGVADSRFPDDDPLDQFYTPTKMSTYRLLGRHIAEELMHDPAMKDVLSRLIRGESLSRRWKGPEGAGERATCEAYCGSTGENGSRRSCVWDRPRAFRPPIGTAPDGERAGG
jgi:hypothetical protein